MLQQLRGQWFNAINALLAFCSQKNEKAQDVLRFKHKVVRLFSLLYLSALEAVSSRPDLPLECFDLDGFDRKSLDFMAQTHDRVEVILHWIQHLIYRADIAGTLDVASPILTQVYSNLAAGNVTFNDARKIAVYPIPFPFAQIVTIMLMAHWVLTTGMCAYCVPYTPWAAGLSFITVFSFWSINFIACVIC